MTDNKYSTSKIYRLVNALNDEVLYVGSTIDTLTTRLYGHEKNLTDRPKSVHNHIRDNVGIDNVRIELICHYPCECETDMRIEEQRHIDIIGIDNLFNERRAHITNEERIEEAKLRAKLWYEDNKEKAAQYDLKRRKDPEFVESKTKYLKNYYAKNSVEQLLKAKERRKDPEFIERKNKYLKEYYSNITDEQRLKNNQQSRKRRASKTPEQLAAINEKARLKAKEKRAKNKM
jgi:hypothetical protein